MRTSSIRTAESIVEGSPPKNDLFPEEQFPIKSGARRPPAVVVANSAGIIQSVNHAMCRLFEYQDSELVGVDIKILMPESTAAVHDQILKKYLERGAFKRTTSRLVTAKTKSGVLIKISLTLTSMKMGDRVLISALIEEVEEKLFSLVADKDGTMLKVVGNCEATCGYSPIELEGENLDILMPPNQRHRNRLDVIGKMSNREILHKDGFTVPVTMLVTLAANASETFVIDIMEIQEKLETVLVVDMNGRIASVGCDCPLIFGYLDEEQMIGMSIFKIAPKIPLKEGIQVATCLHSDGSHFFLRVDIQRCRKDGVSVYQGVIQKLDSSRLPRVRAAKRQSRISYEDTTEDHQVLDWFQFSDKKLGTGFFGTVRVATHKLTGMEVAVKTLKKRQYEDVGMDYPPREVELNARLHHPSIARFFQSVITEDAVYMIYEKIDGGELFDYVMHNDFLSETEARTFARQIIGAVAYMHQCGVVHRDLKLENILLDSNRRIKVIDFGLGNFIPRNANDMLITFCGSPDYAPPELWMKEPYHGPEVDIWAIGVIVFIMTTGFIPFSNCVRVMECEYYWPIKGKYSTELKEIVDSIFKRADQRCTMGALLKHPWITDHGRLCEVSWQEASETKVNMLVLDRMEELGLPREDVTEAVVTKSHNQLFTTYNLLEFQLESELQRRRSSSATPDTPRLASPQSPRVERTSLDYCDSPGRSTLPESGSGNLARIGTEAKRCVIF